MKIIRNRVSFKLDVFTDPNLSVADRLYLYYQWYCGRDEDKHSFPSQKTLCEAINLLDPEGQPNLNQLRKVQAQLVAAGKILRSTREATEDYQERKQFQAVPHPPMPKRSVEAFNKLHKGKVTWASAYDSTSVTEAHKEAVVQVAEDRAFPTLWVIPNHPSSPAAVALQKNYGKEWGLLGNLFDGMPALFKANDQAVLKFWGDTWSKLTHTEAFELVMPEARDTTALLAMALWFNQRQRGKSANTPVGLGLAVSALRDYIHQSSGGPSFFSQAKSLDATAFALHAAKAGLPSLQDCLVQMNQFDADIALACENI